jgi:toxin-antitoxin system PIN domain toxin
MFVVDTNVLVYAANRDSPFHETCRARLEAWSRSPDAWFVTWGILYEFLRVATHRRVLSNPWTVTEAWTFVRALLDSPGLRLLEPTERHAAMAERVFADNPHLTGSIVHDAHTAILMREHGVRRIYTRDTGFHRFEFLEVVDPTLPSVHEPPARARRPRVRRR